MSNAWIGSWLFVIGSFLFTGDASIDAFETCSFRAVVRLLACLLFTVGCFLLMPQAQQE
jgi:uncharacterized membrane protein YgdD (TMEM256/DUF423 family)